MCRGEGCPDPLKNSCFRFRARDLYSGYLSYFTDAPFKNNKCLEYWFDPTVSDLLTSEDRVKIKKMQGARFNP